MSSESLGAMPARELLESVSGGNLAPGGISMAALMGAIAAALVGLVGRLTAGKPGYEPLTEEMERLVERAQVLTEQMLALMDQEVEAFNQLVGSIALPRGNGEEQEIRRDCIRISRRGYTQVPLQVAQVGMEVLPIVESCIRYGNREAIADGGVALLATIAAVRGASLHVLINLGGQEEEWASASREKVQKGLEQLAAVERELWPMLLQQVESHDG